MERLQAAEKSTEAERERAWREASLPTSIGGLSVGGHGRLCAGARAGCLLAAAPVLVRTCSLLHGMHLDSLANVGPLGAAESVPLLVELRELYGSICMERDAIQCTYDEFDQQVYHTMRAGKLLRFRPSKLPTSKALSPLAMIFDLKSPSPTPRQRTLCLVSHHSMWLQCCTKGLY